MVKLKFNETTFGWGVELLFSPYSELCEHFKSSEWDTEEDFLFAHAACFFCAKLNLIIIWFNSAYKNDRATFAEALAHEMLHAVLKLASKYDVTSEELLCVLHSNLMEKSYKKIISYQKKHKILNVSDLKG